MKFKVGDKVRIVNVNENTVNNLCRGKHIGKTFVINSINPLGGMNTHYGGHNEGWIYFEDELELAEFTKSDLKDGMVVECSNGKRKMLINGAFRGIHCYTAVSAYTDTLECRYNESTINKVYTSKALSLSSYFDDKNLTLIWERPKEEPAKKMTVAEIEKELGYKVEIVSEGN